MYFYCALLHNAVVWAGAQTCSCKYMRVLDKDREEDGERESESTRKIDSERVQRRYLSVSDREDSPEGRSQPFSTKNDT